MGRQASDEKVIRRAVGMASQNGLVADMRDLSELLGIVGGVKGDD